MPRVPVQPCEPRLDATPDIEYRTRLVQPCTVLLRVYHLPAVVQTRVLV